MATLEELLACLRAYAADQFEDVPDELRVKFRSGRILRMPVPGRSNVVESPPSNSPCRHSDDFRSVNWHGVTYQFNDRQAQVIRVLWEAVEAGLPDVSKATLLEAAESDSKDLRDLFRGAEGAYHPAWRGMIVKSTRLGWYRLSMWS